MTLLADKLKNAGADTLGAEFISRLTEAVRRYPDSVVDAWRCLGDMWGYAKARQVMKDMSGLDGKEKHSPPTPLSAERAVPISGKPIRLPSPKPYQPRVKPDPARIEIAKEKVIKIIHSQFKSRAGIWWSEYTYQGLQAEKFDGLEADAVIAIWPAGHRNDGTKAGEAIGIKKIDKAIAAFRAS